ncbi:PREDICTED: two-component response regulator-like APRR1 [Nelumbo nucifera]|uniref:Two-component response regulator-like APRR1 n=2 Tax=Nelumbo nucifera TaxID=4432 RepID=A0A1U7ZJT8_NELNU|nr:PREDICTED: two-component response regulator-like APRR1 [Nelumbo nucifera]DAD25990.1 TPA_asm: hypothetical protein HUJ06_027458 [Nelumbo nucifera]
MYDCGDLFALSCNSSIFNGYPPEFAATLFPALVPPPATLAPARLINNEFDSVREALAAVSSSSSSSSSCCYGSGTASAGTSYYVQQPNLVERSMSSSHSLQNNGFHHHQPIFSTVDESCPEALDLETSAMRKMYSSGDLQQAILTMQQRQSHHSESPLSHENCCGGEGSNKAVRYSAEERKDRIERYRSKRNQRNFNKKIKYACRKTLADSRPRIRGRFARNEEVGESSQTHCWSQIMGDVEDEDEDDVWTNFLDAFSTNLMP